MATPRATAPARHPGYRAAIEVPAPTAWPFVLAAGVTLMFAGLLTATSVCVLGVVLAGAACVGWFREVFPHSHEIALSMIPDEVRVSTERRQV